MTLGGYPASVWAFTAASLTVWLLTLVWTLRQGKRRTFYLLLFLSATLFWSIGEYLAIRLGKYQYAAFPPWLVLVGGGQPDSGDVALRGLTWVLSHFFADTEITVANCRPAQHSWNVPFPVIALETALLFSFIRASHLWLKHTGPTTALASAGISGLLMINVTAVLDPVVSTTQWCGTGPNPELHGLTLGIWHWFTNDTHTGYWFGVPLVNYVAWFLTAATFSAAVQLDDDGPRGVIEWCYRRFGGFGPVVVALFAFALLMPIKVGLDKLLLHMPARLFGDATVDPRLWQFGVLGGLNALGLFLLVAFGQFRQHARFEWVTAYAQLVVFAFCLGALLHTWNNAIFLVWLVTFLIAATTIASPLFRGNRGRTPGRGGELEESHRAR